MKVVVSILIILFVCVGGYKLWEYWDKVSQEKEQTERAADGSDIKEQDLPGMSYELLDRYNAAKQKGVSGVRDFLAAYGKAPRFDDPRKAWIELDYALLVTGSDPKEAKRVFLEVKERTPTNSIIYPRIRAMSKTFE